MHLKNRVKEVESGKYDKVLDELTTMGREDLEKLYTEREREPDMAPSGSWMPKEKQYL
jgi:hypothetical protein